MFRHRLLTSLVLVPLVLFAIYYANIWILGTAILLLVLIGTWEWTQLIPILHFVGRIFFTLILLLFIAINKHWFNDWLLCNLVLWVAILVSVMTFPMSQTFWGNRIIVSGLCLFLLPLFANTMLEIYEHPQGKSLIVYLLFIVWATDIGAYLAGKRWGRHKLIPQVSPGKTIEGAMGGFIFAMLIATIARYYFNPHSMIIWYAIAIGTTLISMLGDLLISMLKRRCKLKDTGQLFPGHGGVLDRLDSLIAAAPFFYYGLTFMAISS